MSARTAALLAGGLGTRVASLTGGAVPKALLSVAGRPFIDHKMEELRRLGVARAVLLLGVHAEQIIDHVGDGSRWGITIDCVVDGERLLGTGGAVKRALSSLPSRFWVTYGDTLLDADLSAGEALVDGVPGAGVMTVLHNCDRWQPSNVTVTGGRVTAYSKGDPPGSHEYIDYGYLLLPAPAFSGVDDDEFDLTPVLSALIAEGRLHAQVVTERFHEVGTPEALRETERWLRRPHAPT